VWMGYGAIGCFGSEGTFRGHLAHTPCSEQGHLPPGQAVTGSDIRARSTRERGRPLPSPHRSTGNRWHRTTGHGASPGCPSARREDEAFPSCSSAALLWSARFCKKTLPAAATPRSPRYPAGTRSFELLQREGRLPSPAHPTIRKLSLSVFQAGNQGRAGKQSRPPPTPR